MSWFSKHISGPISDAVGGAVGGIKSLGRAVDPTYSRGALGRYTYRIARPAVATAAAGLTGGASVIAGERGLAPKSTFGVKPTVEGYQIGAQGPIGAIASTVQLGLAGQVAESQPIDTPPPEVDANKRTAIMVLVIGAMLLLLALIWSGETK